MAARFALLFLSSILLATSFWSAVAGGDADAGEVDDILIRQVVDQGNASDDNSLTDDHRFEIFKKRFTKAYATKDEHDYRLTVFKANMRRARRHQKLDPSAIHGVTQFSDLTPKEFRRRHLGVNRRLRLPVDANKAPILPTNNLPTDFDWRDHGAVTPVKDQVILAEMQLFLFLFYWKRTVEPRLETILEKEFNDSILNFLMLPPRY